MHFWVNINELPALIFRPSANGSAGTEADAAEGLYRADRLQPATQAVHAYRSYKVYTKPSMERAMDKRNFRKRIAELDCIEKTDKIDKTGSKRGAALYQFNEKAIPQSSEI